MLRPRTVAFLLTVCLLWAPPCRGDRLLLAPSASLGLPLGAAASLGTAFQLLDDGDSTGAPAVFLHGDLGIDVVAISLGLGVAGWNEDDSPSPWCFVCPPWNALAIGLQATAVRMRDHPITDTPNATYVGPSLAAWAGNIRSESVTVNIGALFRTDAGGDRFMPYFALRFGSFFGF